MSIEIIVKYWTPWF